MYAWLGRSRLTRYTNTCAPVSDFALGVAIAGHVLFVTWWRHCLAINYEKTVDDATVLL